MQYTIYNQEHNKQKRKLLRKSQTAAEKILWGSLRNKQIGYKFRRQHGIGPFIVDFYCPTLKLVIELDGETHAELSVQENDKRKADYIKENGLHIIRFSDEVLLGNPEKVLHTIKQYCQQLEHASLVST